MKKRIVSIIICLVMVFSAVASYGCSRTMANNQTEAPQNPTLDISSRTIITFEDFPVTAFNDVGRPYVSRSGIWIEDDGVQDVIENPTLSSDTLFATYLEFSSYDKDLGLEPLKEYLIRLGKALNDEGYALDWKIVSIGKDADGKDIYKVYFSGLLTAEQILLVPEKFTTLRFDFYIFGTLNEDNEVVYPNIYSPYQNENPPHEVIASSQDVTEAEVAAACSKSSPADYDCLDDKHMSPQAPEIADVPAVEYSLEGKRVLYASDLAGDEETGKGGNKEMNGPTKYIAERTREYLLADENSDAVFAVQLYVYHGFGRTEADARNWAMYTAKKYAEWGCPLNWAVVRAEGRDGYYAFLYGYATAEQLQNMYQPYIDEWNPGYCATMLALADVDANGNIVIDLMEGAKIVDMAK